MSRRLLLVLAGLGGGIFAFVLWSGPAYASAPRTLDAPGVPAAVGGARSGPVHDGLPLPPLPRPATPQPAVKPIVDSLPPVVGHTLTRVHAVVPPVVSSILPVTPAPAASPHPVARPATHAAAARPHGATAARHAQRTVSRAAAAKHTHAVRASVPTPLRATHHARTDRIPFGADDAPSASSSSGFGSFYAVTTRDAGDPPSGWSHVAFEVARAPAIVVLRDIARPG